MKIIASLFFGLILCTFAGTRLYAQDITIILLRHAEKDVSASANKADPELTAEGQKRAERLVETVKKYQPEQIFSTIFKRARNTATPLAENLNPNYRLQIQFYDYAELEKLAERLLKLKVKSVVVVGHNTTTPELANLLIKQNKYKALDDNEYNKIWIIKIKKNKVVDKVIEY
jgi:2,3-bisphosphoglycerate-dependent phosphoglycerate mutase